MTNASSLQSRPTLRLAVGQLPASEQSHVQISMRVLSSKLAVPCVVVPDETADITLKPCERHVGSLCLLSATHETHVERPVRLVPLSDALNEIIEDMLRRDGAAPAARADAGTPATAARTAVAGERTLLHLLLERNVAGPLCLTLASGREILIDRRYQNAYVVSDDGQLQIQGMANDALARIEHIGDVGFEQRTGKGSRLVPIAVEQLCWLLTPDASVTHFIDHWHADTAATALLHSWPNLSQQADGMTWLGVIHRASRGPVSLASLLDAAQSLGIESERARYGLSLLFVFKHLSMQVNQVAASVSQINEAPLWRIDPTQPDAAAGASGMLGRLRTRLRALVG